VQGNPPLFAFAGGKVAARHSGLVDTSHLRSWVDRFAGVKA
jgi:hypothetical protein